jgi:hypothetical protein
MRMLTAVAFGWLLLSGVVVSAQEFKVEEATSATVRAVGGIAPHTIVFNDHAQDKSTLGASLIPFEDWARTRSQEPPLLSLYPGYVEPVKSRKVGGTTKTSTDKLAMYVAEARFTLPRAPKLADLGRFATLAFAQHLDPAVTHRVIQPAEITPLTNPKFAHNQNPNRPWCVGIEGVCLRSHYRLEGKLPLGIALANKLRDPDKKISDYLEFESELAVRAPEALDRDAVVRLTRLDTPIIGAVEQSTFYVNQVLQFAKFLVVFQTHPTDAAKAVVTAFMALAVEAKVLDMKKEYARVPVLRNLVPIQVLMGKSSFNTGQSISGGLPGYARSRIQTVARILENG